MLFLNTLQNFHVAIAKKAMVISEMNKSCIDKTLVDLIVVHSSIARQKKDISKLEFLHDLITLSTRPGSINSLPLVKIMIDTCARRISHSNTVGTMQARLDCGTVIFNEMRSEIRRKIKEQAEVEQINAIVNGLSKNDPDIDNVLLERITHPFMNGM